MSGVGIGKRYSIYYGILAKQNYTFLLRQETLPMG